jgi:hypothetical protein
MLVTLGHCNTSAMNVSVLHLVFEPAKIRKKDKKETPAPYVSTRYMLMYPEDTF